MRARWEISAFFADKLYKLQHVDVALIVDDSHSMNELIEDQWTAAAVPTRQTRRWDEAHNLVSALAAILIALRPRTPLPIYFLNRGGLVFHPAPDGRVKVSQMPPTHARESITPAAAIGGAEVDVKSAVDAAFAAPPAGFTPLAETYERLHGERRWAAQTAETRWLTLVVTDGEPTTRRGDVDLSGFRATLVRLRVPAARFPITFALCTSDESVVEFYNLLDRELAHVDVVDDYRSERAQVVAAQGRHFPFSRGDYVAKLLLGGIDAQVDALDETVVGARPTPCPDRCVVS